MSRKALLVVLIMILTAGSVVFASGQEERAAEGITELELWFHGGESRQPYFEHMLNVLLPKQRPELRAELVGFGGWDDMHQNAMLAIAGGSPPDASTIKSMNIADLAVRGTIEDLGPYLENHNVDTDIWFDVLINFDPVVRGNIYALPLWGDMTTLYRNEDIMAEAGIAPDEFAYTWDELFDHARRVRDATGMERPLQSPDSDMNYWFLLVEQHGGRLMDEDYSEAMVLSPEVRAATQQFYDWVHSDLTPEYGQASNQQALTEQVAIWRWFGSVKEQWATFAPDVNVSSIPWPSGPESNHAVSFSTHLSMFSAGKNLDETFQMILFLASDEESQNYLARDLGNSPVLKSLSDQPYLRDRYSYFTTEWHLEGRLMSRPVMPNGLQIYQEAGQMLQAILAHEVTIDAGLASYNDFINDVIARNRDLW